MESPGITILLVNWNGKTDTLACLDSLRHLTYPHYTVMVVDNGSTDGSQEAIASAYREVRLIETGENLGFGGANNVGILESLRCGADAVLLLNSDTVVAPDFIEPLVNTLFSDPKIGAVNPKIYYHSQPEVIWSAGGMIHPGTAVATQRHVDEQDNGQADAPADIDYAVGCAVMVRRDAIEKAGLLDESFFMYYEEAEWCRRMRESGYRIVYVPESKLWHKVSATMEHAPERMLYYFCRNRLLYLRRSGAGGARQAWIIVKDFLRMALAYRLRRQPKRSKAVLRAITDFCVGRFGKAPI
jgi:GT2 family glycosyltransferase